MIIILTDEQYRVFQEIHEQIENRTIGGSECAILVTPDAAKLFKERTGHEITEAQMPAASFSEASIVLHVIYPDRIFNPDPNAEPHDYVGTEASDGILMELELDCHGKPHPEAEGPFSDN